MLLTANRATAGHGFSFGGGNGGGIGGGNGGGNRSGFKVQFGGGNHSHHNKHHHHHGHHHHHHKYYHRPVKKYYVEPVYVAPSVHPFHSCSYVVPGDTWYTISAREYGKPNFALSIAAFNGLSTRVRLVVGQKLLMPVILPNGSMTASAAPAGEPYFIPASTGYETSALGADSSAVATAEAGMDRRVTAAGIKPATGTASNETADVRQAVTAGSLLSISDGVLGDKGKVRLLVGNVAFPVDVIERSAGTAQIRLPQLELTAPVEAELEIQRADGSPVSKTAIKLMPAASMLTLRTR
jgi:hypothetical protein